MATLEQHLLLCRPLSCADLPACFCRFLMGAADYVQ